MWDAFLSRACQSCEGFGTPKTTYNKRKLDINSIEYQSYIRRDVLGYLDKYAMPSKRDQVKGKKPPTGKLRPVYLRVEPAPKLEGKPKEVCGCSKPAGTKSEATVDSDRGFTLSGNVSLKCPVGYCELVRKRQSAKVKKGPTVTTPEPEEVSKEPKPCKRHPVLILRKKRVVSVAAEEPAQMPDKLGRFSLCWVSGFRGFLIFNC